MTEEAERNLVIQEDIVRLFLKRLVNCRSVVQLVTLVPAAVQDRTRQILDNIVEAHVKKATAALLLAEWRDVLAKENYGTIMELKSIRGPSIQVSKLAEKEGGISKDFSESLKEAKKSALTRMIEIKNNEVEALAGLCKVTQNHTNTHNMWMTAANAEETSPEAFNLLTDSNSVKSLVQAAISIGENTAQKQLDKKQKKSSTVKRAQVGGTAVMPTDPKSLEAFVKEIAKRNKQSAQDKSKAKKPGKGQRGAGPSKTKNQKNSSSKVTKKDRKRKNGKRSTSSKKQQKKP